jgi:multiple sugar transport system substrate-binding protein
MLERARLLGQYPPRRSLYEDETLIGVLPIPPARARAIIDRAVARPVTPVYTQLSGLLQIRLHRALSGQQQPAAALADAAQEMRGLLARLGLAPSVAGEHDAVR